MHDAADADPQMAIDLDLASRSSLNVMVTAKSDADRAASARTIHARSARRHDPFVAVCSIPPAAARDVDDWFEQAAGGTVFVDQIGQLSRHAQAQLLFRLRDHARSDRAVRVIAGSDRSLLADLSTGAFSDELFYRLNTIHIDQMHQHETSEAVMKAREIMSTPPYTCAPNADLATVAKIMWDHDCGFVPIVDASGVVMGVVTDRDICIATATRRLLPEHVSASQAMTTPIHTCLSDDSISDVLTTMKQHRIRRLPTIDANGRLQGVVSLNDIVLASSDTREPTATDIVSALASICAHRRFESAIA